MYWQCEFPAQFLGEVLHFSGLCPFGAAHAQGQADYDLSHLVLADDSCQLLKVQPLVLPVERLQSLRRDAQRVGNGQPDSP